VRSSPPTSPIRIGAAFWVQRTDWPSLRDAALAAERSGADDLWFDDHLLCDESDPDDGKLEGWAGLSALAAVTSKARIGLLVAANTFRNPGLTAKLATTVDHVSGGRSILGLGSGWFEREHEAFGVDFGGGFGERLDRLGESVGIVRRLLDGDRVDHDGPTYRLRDAVCAPRPLQPRLPIMIGGSGPKKTLPIVARHADLWNAYGTPATLAASFAILREHCLAVGRDPTEIDPTHTMNVVVRTTRSEAEDAWQLYLERHRPSEWESRVALGSIADVAAAVADYAAVGFRHPIFVFRSPWDLATIERLGEIRKAVAQRLAE
jgi:alkanesulfonate monooxygenase SsuD/methylene tetrahydromethanopterin reductase-like flavin-dependent oxidoreductase (luciferase family)